MKDLDVAGAPQPGFVVEYAQCPDGVALVIHQGYAEIGNNRAIQNHGMVSEYRVESGVLKNQRGAVCDRILADDRSIGVCFLPRW